MEALTPVMMVDMVSTVVIPGAQRTKGEGEEKHADVVIFKELNSFTGAGKGYAKLG